MTSSGFGPGPSAPRRRTARPWRRTFFAAARPRLAARVQMLGHRLAGALKLVKRPIDRRRIILVLDLVHLLDRRRHGRAVRFAELLLVLLDQLLELVHPLLGSVPGLRQLTPLLVLSRMRVGITLHPLDFVLVQTLPSPRCVSIAPCPCPGRAP